jgi:hypothetical protein
MTKSYLELREEEEEGLDAPPAAAPKSALPDLSTLEPTPAPRPTPERQAAAVEVGRGRGFDRPTAAPSREQRPARRAKADTAQGPTKRYIVSLNERPPQGQQGQIALTGEAAVLYDFIRRAHYERRSRGELLAELLALYEEKKGPTPATY